MYIFQGDISILEWVKGRTHWWSPLASLASREDSSLFLDVWSIRSLTLRQHLLKYVNRPLSKKDWVVGISAFFLCIESWGSGWLKTVLLFATVLQGPSMKTPLTIRAKWPRGISSSWQPKNPRHQKRALASFRKYSNLEKMEMAFVHLLGLWGGSQLACRCALN